MPSYLITGSTRGLGLALVRQLSQAQTPVTILATGRSATANSDLTALIDSVASRPNNTTRIHYLSLDVTSASSIQDAAIGAAELLEPGGLDVLINNAAITIPGSDRVAAATDAATLTTLLNTNVIAVQNTTAAFLPLLELGQRKMIVNMTSALGSITSAARGETSNVPKASYKISKVALNMLTVLWAQELGEKGFTVFALNPGHLSTELGDIDGFGAELDVDVGAKAVVEVVASAGQESCGRFRNILVPGSVSADGKDIPW